VLKGAKFYEPTSFGFEKEIRKRLEFWQKLTDEARRKEK